MSKPDFGRLRKSLFLQGEPDRVPLIELGLSDRILQSFLQKSVEDANDRIGAWAGLNYDYVAWSPGFPYPTADKSGSWACEGKGLISNQDDMEKHWGKEIEKDFSPLTEYKNALVPGMGIIVTAPGVYEQVWMAMGFENLVDAYGSNTGFLDEMFRRAGTAIVALFKRIAGTNCADALWYTDDIAYGTSTVFPPDFYRKHVFPYMEEIGSICKEKKVPFLYHSDGNLLGVMDDLISCGVNAIHPIEPQAMDLKYLKSKYGTRLCFLGNIDVDILARGTVDDIRDAVRNSIKAGAKGGGYCVGSGSSVPSYVSHENYKAMIDAAIEFGSYPLKV